MTETAREKRRGPLRIFGIIGLVLFVVVIVSLELMLSLFSGSAKIRVSEETTYITEPLDENGNVDYVLAENQRRSNGIAAEDNAMVDYFRITGPGGYDKAAQDEIIKWLGTNPFQENQTTSGLFDEPLYEKFEELPEAPWTAEDEPELKQWLTANEATLNAAAEAAKKPAFFMPLIPSDDEAVMISITLEPIQNLRYLVAGLNQRCLHRIGSGQVEAALEDIETIRRMARHCSQGGFIVSQLVAIALESQAIECEEQLILSDQLSKEQLMKLIDSFDQLPQLGDMRAEITYTERLVTLDAAHAMAGGLDMSGLAASDGESHRVSPIRTRSIDWNVVFKVINDWYERIDEVLAAEDPIERRKRYNALEESLIAVEQRGFFGLWMFDRNARSQRCGDLIAAIMLPAVGVAADAADRVKVLREMNLVTAALYAYRLDHDAFPESLEQLSPEYLDSVPGDRFQAGQPFKYQVVEGGFRLYSIGQDLIDNEGEEDPIQGDLVIDSNKPQ